MTLDELNALPEAAARERLAECLDVERWVDAILVGRPYADLGALTNVAATAAGDLSDEELGSALARHPRIGEQVSTGSTSGSPSEAADREHSEREQAGVDPGDADVVTRLAEGNRAYEERFDRVFLIRAAGRDAEEILAELERRLDNDDVTEREETVTQLREIALLRLEGMMT